jgi:hypothetical protein
VDKLKLYEHEGKVYILDGVKMWVYDGETIKEVEPYVAERLD